jgi:MYXO-CTERM domain-containing protein
VDDGAGDTGGAHVVSQAAGCGCEAAGESGGDRLALGGLLAALGLIFERRSRKATHRGP